MRSASILGRIRLMKCWALALEEVIPTDAAATDEAKTAAALNNRTAFARYSDKLISLSC